MFSRLPVLLCCWGMHAYAAGRPFGPHRVEELLELTGKCFSPTLDPLQALRVLGAPGRQVGFNLPCRNLVGGADHARLVGNNALYAWCRRLWGPLRCRDVDSLRHTSFSGIAYGVGVPFRFLGYIVHYQYLVVFSVCACSPQAR